MTLRKFFAFSLSVCISLSVLSTSADAAPKKASAAKKAKAVAKKPAGKTVSRSPRKRVVLNTHGTRTKVYPGRGHYHSPRTAMLHLPAQITTGESSGLDATAQPGVRYTFGTPAGSESPTQTIAVTLQDNAPPRHEPLTFKRGEVVQFVVRNDSQQAYEVAIGDTQTHKAHVSMLRSVPGLPRVDDATSIIIPPQQSKTLTWKFSRQHPRYPIELAVLQINDVLSTPHKSRINLHP